MLEKLDNLLRVQSELDEPTRRATKEALVAANLDFALACLKKVVIEVSTQEVARDPELQEEARRRRQAREAKTRFSHETFRRLQRELPKMLRPRADARELDCVAIYNAAIGGEAEGVARESEAAPANEERIGDLAREVENELANLSVDEQPRFVARLLAALTQMLQQSRNAESTATKIAQIFFNLFESHRALTIDVFLVCRRFHATLGRTLIQWAFEGELSAELIAALLRTALVEPNELDRRFAAALGECGERALSAVVDFYARTLGEERLIDFDALPLSARALCAAARDGRGDALSTDRRAFLFAMTESGDERIPSPRIAALRSVLSSAVESLFRVRDEALFRLCADFLDRRLSARDEPSADRALDALFAGAPIDFRAFAVYLTDIAINATVRGYALVDAVARALSAAVRRADNALRGQTFENALFGVAAAIAKAHSLSAPFNARAFFRFLRAFVESGEAIDDFRRKKAFIEILELLSPTKYSRFAFCWLSLIAARSLLSTLRSDESAVYSPLLFALIDFCRTAFAFDALTSQRTRLLYIGILRYFLVLQNDYRDFLAANAFALVERLPTQFRQLRNVILSVCADGRAPNPFLAAAVEPRPSAEDANAERVAAALGVIGQLDAALECKGGDAREIAAALRTSDGRPRVAAVRAAVRVMPRIAARAQRREQSVELFVKLLCVGGDELNEEILRAIFDSLTDPTDSTLYFVQLLLSLAERCDERVSEQLLRQMFERLIVQKPHPWGLLHFFNRALTGSAALRRRAPPVDELLRLAAECVQINNFDVCFG